MEAWLHTAIPAALAALALPAVGLPAIFVISLVSATLLPLGSEPAVFGYVQLAPTLFWPAVLVATLGNTLGGATNYVLGAGIKTGYCAWRTRHHPAAGTSAEPASRHPGKPPPGGRWRDVGTRWFQRVGPPVLLLSWLPAVGDPLCAVAGWLKLPFWPCVAYMAIGKFLRYVFFTAALLHAWPWVSQWLYRVG